MVFFSALCMDLDPDPRIVNGYRGGANGGVKMHRSGGRKVLTCLPLFSIGGG